MLERYKAVDQDTQALPWRSENSPRPQQYLDQELVQKIIPRDTPITKDGSYQGPSFFAGKQAGVTNLIG